MINVNVEEKPPTSRTIDREKVKRFVKLKFLLWPIFFASISLPKDLPVVAESFLQLLRTPSQHEWIFSRQHANKWTSGLFFLNKCRSFVNFNFVFQIYTWMDASLKELTALIRDVNPDTRRKGTYFDFALVFPDTRPGAYRIREIGVTCSGSRGADDSKTLSQAKFQIGDYLDINISPPNRKPEPRQDRRERRPY